MSLLLEMRNGKFNMVKQCELTLRELDGNTERELGVVDDDAVEKENLVSKCRGGDPGVAGKERRIHTLAKKKKKSGHEEI